MKEPFAIMLCGIPLAGKSTFYKKHFQHLDHVLLSTDAYIDRECTKMGISYNQGFDHFIRDASKWFNEEFRAAVLANKNIIFDQTNLNRKSRRKRLVNLPAFYEKIAIFFPLNLEEALIRNPNRKGKFIPISVLESMHSAIQIPVFAEGFDHIYPSPESYETSLNK